MWQQTILGSPWDWCHLYSRTVGNAPLMPTAETRGNAPSPVFLHTHRPQPPGVSCLSRVITERTTPNHIPVNRKASPVIRDRVLRESLFWAEVLILNGKAWALGWWGPVVCSHTLKW